jgi:hypothetical protein
VAIEGLVLDNRYNKVMAKDSLPYEWIAPVEYYNKINRETAPTQKGTKINEIR